MTVIGWIQILLYCAIVVALVKPLGGYMTRVFNGERTFLSPVLRPVEAALYWLGGVDEKREQHWLTYTVAMLLFHVGGFLILYALLRLQAVLPFNPAEQSAVRRGPLLQHGGELHHQHQLAELRRRKHAVLSRADARPDAPELPLGGDRHRARGRADPRLRARVDAARSAISGSISPAARSTSCCRSASSTRCSSSGRACRRRSAPYVDATTLEGAKQTIAVGPVASQIAIKMLGTNGGGFFNANAAHPFENPTALSNFVQMISIFAIGAALTNVFGRMVGNQRQGWAILAAMGVLFLAGVAVCLLGGGARQRRLHRARPHRRQHGGQGGPLRHRRLRAVRRHHHRRLLRRRQRHARLASPRSAA